MDMRMTTVSTGLQVSLSPESVRGVVRVVQIERELTRSLAFGVRHSVRVSLSSTTATVHVGFRTVHHEQAAEPFRCAHDPWHVKVRTFIFCRETYGSELADS